MTDAVVDWYLWQPPEKEYRDNRMPRFGGLCVLYNNELYDWSNGLTATVKAFGIYEKKNYQQYSGLLCVHRIMILSIVASTRDLIVSHLTWSGGKELPMEKWADDFAANMPAPIPEHFAESQQEPAALQRE